MNIESVSKKKKGNPVLSCCASKKCSDYDEECVDVKDPVACWFGGVNITKNGVLVYLEKADGYCPLAQHCN